MNLLAPFAELLLGVTIALQIPGIQPGPQPPAETEPDAIFQAPISEIDAYERRFITLREFVSPVTGERFMAHILTGNVSMGKRDHDGCPHPPINALAYTLVIDPYSGFAAYPENYGGLSRWTLAELKDILGSPRFSRDAPEGQPWAGSYPWEKFENAARLAEAGKAAAMEQAQWWLQAAWSVRLDTIAGEVDFGSELTSASRGLARVRGDTSQLYTPYRLQLAASWAQLYETDELGTVPPADAALAIAWLYRWHGELPQARRWLQRAADADPALRDGSVYSYLNGSIRLEHEYLSRARDLLIESWEDEAVRLNARGGAAFLIGELSRRLGDDATARFWYDEAQGNSLGAVDPGLLRQQRELVAESVPPAVPEEE